MLQLILNCVTLNLSVRKFCHPQSFCQERRICVQVVTCYLLDTYSLQPANKPLYMAFVDLEKAFDRVPRDVIWWAMRKLGIDEWLVRLVQSMSGKYPCGVCQSGVGSSNAIFCGGCKRWVHKKCSGIKGPLRPDPEFRCARCLGTARAIDEREVSEVEVGNEKLEVVPEFCYLGDMLSAGGGCELAAITRCKCAWGKFRQLLPLLTNRHLPLLTRGKVYSSCVRSVMLHAAETWAMKVDTLNRLRRNDRAMIRWICNVRAKDEVSSDSLLTKLGIQDLDVVLRTSRMRWFGHVERSTGWIAEVRKLNVAAQKRSGRPRKSWDEVLENDRKKLGMDSADPQNRSEWRGRLRERLVKKPNPR